MRQCVQSLIVFLLTCQLLPAVTPSFNGNKAFSYLTTQTDMGPRNPGSPGHAACIQWLVEKGEKWADTVVVQEFTGFNPHGPDDVSLTNVIYRFQPGNPERIMLSAHFDTRPVADLDRIRRNEPIPGANDGASGVAVLLHIAEILAQSPPPVGVDIAFWDGEDMGRPDYPEEFCQGSRFYSRNPLEPIPQKGILIDMIGDTDLQIFYELYSLRFAPGLAQVIWDAAKKAGYADVFIQKPGPGVYDDHVPLSEGGIPTVDIIDFQYPDARTNYWHTHEDTADKCAPESLQCIGDVLLMWLYAQE
ncbi:MAG: M28 family peptidase [Candidatus Marinimicrobia bacterium]|nr:M28 family peptidase [Candidatus Neomarinimicrobiota bacterium]